jgi:hypothetical protein
MKKSLIMLILLVVAIAAGQRAEAQCPTGYVVGNNSPVIVEVAANCKIYIEYCIDPSLNMTLTPGVHISNITYVGTGCDMMPVMANGMIGVDWAQVLAWVLRNGSEFNYLILPPCDENTFLQVVLTHGGCYHQTTSSYMSPEGEVKVYELEPCDIEGIEMCQMYYELCLDYSSGQAEIVSVSGPPAPQFTCPEEDCYSTCQQ